MTEFSKTSQPSDERRKQGRKKRGVMTEALMLALNREAKNADGVMTKRLNIIAEQLTQKAAEGDTQAIKEVFDRTEGKAAQAIIHQGDEDNPIPHKIVVEIIE